MKSLSDIVSEQHDNRPSYDDPMTDRLLGEIVALAEEVCVLRDRLDTVQRLSEAGEAVSASAIDAFEVDAELTETRLAGHQAYFEALFARLSLTNRSP